MLSTERSAALWCSQNVKKKKCFLRSDKTGAVAPLPLVALAAAARTSRLLLRKGNLTDCRDRLKRNDPLKRRSGGVFAKVDERDLGGASSSVQG